MTIAIVLLHLQQQIIYSAIRKIDSEEILDLVSWHDTSEVYLIYSCTRKICRLKFRFHLLFYCVYLW